MADQLTLRPVAEDDLSFLEYLHNDPAGAGQHEWHGWSDAGSWRRGWAETGLLGDSGGVLMVVHGADRVGCVSWRKTQTGAIAYCWSLGIGLAPQFRGRGHGAGAQRLLVRLPWLRQQHLKCKCAGAPRSRSRLSRMFPRTANAGRRCAFKSPRAYSPAMPSWWRKAPW